MTPTDYLQIITTADRREVAETIARELVEQRLAGCVQIVGPIASIYRWQGVVETAEEWQCVAKTRRDLFADVTEAIRRCHTYEVPEILAVAIDAGSDDYLRWLDEQLRPRES